VEKIVNPNSLLNVTIGEKKREGDHMNMVVAMFDLMA
jgi:hypothetical protein